MCMYVRTESTGRLVNCAAVSGAVFIVYVMYCEGVSGNVRLGLIEVWRGLRVLSVTTVTLLFKGYWSLYVPPV
jgi:hypothetical protein